MSILEIRILGVGFDLSTRGFWIFLPGAQVGVQWVHCSHEVPYCLIEVWRWRIVVTLHSLLVKRSDGGRPPVYTTTYMKTRRA